MKFIELLPSTSFVPFPAFKPSSARVVWSHPNLSFDPIAFAYCNPCPDESAADYSATGLNFLAERYGGSGLAGNGGGVRCGIVESVQIKGCGPNPLAGVTTDYWHRHGALSLQDAIKEVFWSSVLSAALPYGTATAFAILTTGTSFATEVDGYRSSAPRAILLREPILRPAHFMRSTFVQLSTAFGDLPSDAERTRRAIGALSRALAVIFARDCVSVDDCVECLSLAFERSAFQLSAARLKRIHHGSLTGSNFGLDGRWLDFGTTTGLETYRRTITSPGSLDCWSQETGIFEAIYDLSFYLSKYLHPGKALASDVALLIARRFKASMEASHRAYILRLCGVSDQDSLCLPPTLIRETCRLVDRLINLEKGAVALYYGDDRHQMPSSPLRLSANEVLKMCAGAPDQSHAEALLTDKDLPTKLIRDLVENLFKVRSACSQCGIDTQVVKEFSTRLNGSRAPLHRRELDRRIHEIATGPSASISAQLSDLIQQGVNMLGDD